LPTQGQQLVIADHSNTGEYTGDYNELVYLRARFYAPGTGRFLTKDPSRAEANFYLYAHANPVIYTDHSGLFSKRDVANALWLYQGYGLEHGDNFDLFLDNVEYTAERNLAHPKWGFVAALLDASNGDRLEAYRLSVWGSSAVTIFNQPSLTKMVNTSLNYDKNELFWLYSSMLNYDNNGAGGNDARYYVLYSQNGGTKRYVDGSFSTSYPDFKISTLNLTDSAKEIAKHLGKELGTLGCLSYTGGKIVDRFGQVYTFHTVNVGFSYSLATRGIGWVSANPSQPIYAIPDAATLRSNIEGLSVGGSISLLLGASGSYSPGTGSGAGSVSAGLQIGVSFDPTYIEYEYTDPNLGWDWANQWEMGAYGSPPTIFRSTLSTWSP
jgi:RHS repeat-associated protein